MSRASTLRLAACVAAALAAPLSASADPVEDFYKGKNVNFLVGVSAGGGYDLHLRLVARHMVKYIPGRPTPIPQNMTGATGLVMANYMFKVGPKDGTVVGLIQNGLPTYQAVGKEGVQFDARELQWIGSLAATVETMLAWRASGVASIEDLKKREVIAGSNGASGITYMYPLMMNEMLGTRFKMVTGYPGSGALNLAIERGEVEARNNSWSSIKSSKPDWLRDGKINVLVYSGPKQDDLPGVPHLDDLITDPENRQVARVVTAGNRLGHPFAVAPGVPMERVEALRAAFVKMMDDPEFRKEAAAVDIDLQPVSPAELKKTIDDLFAVPDHLKQRARKYFN
ncbi:MAG: Tripartite-type tricarboxylate transporter, receptor component TctC [Hyphomicrobiales bacterium]|nr:Tripartite-type tricarboxylate transporter, receptor component TctC [Hyphomicrobiales bacterium]